jgi:hypothetical protein
MATCASCGAALAPDSRFCARCGAATGDPGPSAGAGSSSPGLTATAPSTAGTYGHHEPFEPGTRLGSRYRIVAFLGAGGMGEVYRADDLELNQPVALKFLPGRMSADAAELDRLRKEVRTAREIAHPNVCRTYDIAMADGHVFLVMEYIGGEDLASVLRRLGRPSSDKAIEIARQLCLGLGAAHEKKILHRDLKPANVMIDDRGLVRITDFGLAGLAEELAQHLGGSGTPAYMAPEQLAGGVATVQSDLYSLGLVLYEVFTGKRAFHGHGAAEIRKLQSDSSPRSPSTLVPDIDPAVERVILRCLEPEPRSRPGSAYQVLGSLPGGDPLAAALAAGETPSPELVANAGVSGGLRPAVAIACVIFVLSSSVWWTSTEEKRMAGFNRSTSALALRSEQVLAEAGVVVPRYSYGGFMENSVYFANWDRGDSSALAYGRAHPEASAGMLYWRRWSPEPLMHPDLHNPSPTLYEPLPGPGSVSVLMDRDGRLVDLFVMPAFASTQESLGTPVQDMRRVTDWPAFVDAAGYDASRMVRRPPTTFLSIGADSVTAAAIAGSGAADPPVTVQADWRHGSVVRFWIDAPWGTSRDPFAFESRRVPTMVERWTSLLFFTIIPLVAAGLFAVRNLRAGRGDRRGAMKLAAFVFIGYLFIHLAMMNVPQIGVLHALATLVRQAPIGHALLHAAIVWVMYMALEPYLRRLWPRVLVSWARLVSGRLRDPIVGRDILIGFAFACFNQVVFLTARALWGRSAGPERMNRDLIDSLSGVGGVLAGIATYATGAGIVVMAFFTLVLICRMLLRSNRAAIAISVAFFSALFVFGGIPEVGLVTSMVVGVIGMASFTYVALRFGFLAAMVGGSLVQVAAVMPWTTDLSVWYSDRMLVAIAILGALLAYGFITALGGRSIFKDPISMTRT